MKKRFSQRALSLILSLIMIIGVIQVGFVFSYAASSRDASKTSGDFKFVVPETIYLYPDLASSDVATSTGFQYYINETTDYAVSGTYDTTGKIYYSYSNASGATLSWSFVDTSFNALSGGSVTASATSLGTSATVNITGGTSPSLAAATQGCYIQWCISYTDSADGVAKKAYNYTYVYKPFIRVVASATEIGTGTSSGANWAGSVTWISGMNSFTSYHTNLKDYDKWDSYSCGYTKNNFAAFISKNSTIYANGTAVGTQQRNGSVGTLSTSSNATNWYVVNTTGANGYNLQQGSNNNPDMYYGGYTDNNNCNFVTGRYRENNKDLSGCVMNKTIAELKVDTSRYSNLSQIPNLAIGLTVTDDQTSDSNSATWYIADASDCTFGDDYYKWHDDENYYGNYNTIIAGQCAGGKWSRAYWECEGIRYVGQWYRAFKGSTGTQGATATYYVHGYYANKDKAGGSNYDASNNTVCQLRTTYYNKSSLRTAIKNAELAMAKLGVNNVSTGYIKSAFFDDNSSYKWTAFRDAYRAAIIGFTQIGNTSNMDTLATNLNNAINALCTKVTLNANGGSQSGTTSQYVTIGKNQTVSVTPSSWSGYSAPTRTGYTFQGWSTSSTATSGAASVTVGYNNTLYAIWKINTSTLTVNPNGGTWDGYTSTRSYTQNYNTTKSIPVPTRTGYTFAGWTKSSSFYGSMSSTTEAATYTFGSANGVTDTITASWSINSYKLDVNWDYTDGNGTAGVSDANSAGYATVNVYSPQDSTSTYAGGSGVGDFYQDVQYNQTWKMVATVKDSSKYILKNGTTYGTSETRTGTMGAENHGETFHIMPVYNIAFNANNGSGSMSTIERVPYDKSQPLTSNAFSRTGYTFNGWNTAANGSGSSYSNGASVSTLTSTAGGTVTLYAQWTKNSFYLQYNGNKPSAASNTVGSIPAKQTLTYDTGAVLGGTPTLTGYTFGGWYKDTSGEFKIGNAGASIDASTVNGFYNTTGVGNGGTYNVYAKWTPITYTVTYNGNGNTGGSTGSSLHTYDVSKALTSNGFTKTGYEFAGWATSATGTVVYGDGASVKNLSSTNNGTVTLYAKWTANKITVSFNGNGSTSGSMTSQEFTYDTAQALKANAFSRSYTVTYNYNGADGGNSASSATASYSFNGWNSAANGGGSYTYTNGQTVTNPCGVSAKNGSATLYAKWTGGNVTLPSPTRTGYSFEGWYTTQDFSGNVYAKGATYTATSNITFYAKWKPNLITLSYDGNGNTGGTVPADSTFYYGSTVHTANALAKEVVVSFEYNGADGGNDYPSKSSSYAFNGWKSSTGSKKIYAANTDVTDSFEAGNANAVQLTAQWDNSSAGIILPTPTRTGYTFDGWYDNGSFNGTKYNANASYTPAANVKMYAKWVANSFSLTYSSNGKTVTAGTMPSAGPYTLVYDSSYQALNGLVSPLIPKAANNVFIGWNTKADGKGTTYYPNTDATAAIVNAMYTLAGNKAGGSLTLYAQWKDISGIDPKSEAVVGGEVEYGIENEEYDVFTGLELVNGSWKEVYDRTELKYDVTTYTTYQAAADSYYTTKTRVLSEVNGQSVSAFLESADNLVTKITNVENTLRSIYRDIFDNGFTISYNGGSQIKGISEGKHSLKDMNLNHYAAGVLQAAKTALQNGKALLAGKVDITKQAQLNNFVKSMATAYISKSATETVNPEYKVYETKSAMKLLTGSEVEAVNYVYSGTSGYTYYCYTNSTNPTVGLIVNESGSKVSYPTRSTVSSETNDSFVRTVKDITNSQYSEYMASGIGMGTEYTGDINGTSYTGADYYNKQSMVKLTPTLTTDREEAIYTISSTDDSFEENAADKSALSGSMDNSAKNIQSISNNPAVTPEGTITVVICYKSKGTFDVEGDQWTDHDKWLKQYHLYRTSGGAQNWEIHGVTANDDGTKPIDLYAIDDPQYGQQNYCSFIYTFKSGSVSSVASNTMNINTADVNSSANLKLLHDKIEEARTASGQSGYDFIKTEAKKWSGRDIGGSGLGFLAWPGSTTWSRNYYPASNSYTYVHLVDRWGNTVDKIIAVPNLDDIAASMKTASAGSVLITEDGGSGINTASVNASKMQIITDDSSTLEGNVYKSTGNTVKVYTGEANKSYTLKINDWATNATTATVKSDAEGYIVMTVEDKEYNYDGCYTFTLNGYEINLYDGVEKHIKSATSPIVYDGEKAYVEIVTSDKVDMAQLMSESGTTSTATTYVDNGDGTRTWTVAKTLGIGEKTYKVKVRVAGQWIDENEKSTITVLPKEAVEYIKSVTNPKVTEGEKATVTIVTNDKVDIAQLMSDSGTTSSATAFTDNGDGTRTWTVTKTLGVGEKTYKVRVKVAGQWIDEGKTSTITVTAKEPVMYIVSATNPTVRKGEKATVTIVTNDKVDMAQLMSESGTTSTATAFTDNGDGTRTWKVTKTLGVGEKTYKVRVKVAGQWIDEGKTSTITVTAD